jgi:hypothetical protein
MPAATTISADWMGASSIIGDAGQSPALPPRLIGMVIVAAPNGPYAAGSTPVYIGQIVDATGTGIPSANLAALTLTIADTLSGEVINGCEAVNILNTDRGTVDGQGNLTIRLEVGDTSLGEVNTPSVQRSLVIDWSVKPNDEIGRHQVNFIILALAGP